MQWSEILQHEARGAYHATRGLFELVDFGARDWRPETGSNWLSTGQLVRHITTASGQTAKGFVTKAWNECDAGLSPDYRPAEGEMMPVAEHYLAYETKEEALAALAADEELFGRMITEAGEERLETERFTAPWGGPERSLGQHMLTCIHHLHVHRAQLFYYLKLRGEPVHTGTLWVL
jgi:hypothetical protein